jgi:hypothetical protein
VLIKASRLQDKADILKQMQTEASSPAMVKQAQTAQAQAEADVAKTQSEANVKHADAGLKVAKTAETQAKTQTELQGEPGQDNSVEDATKVAEAQHGMDLNERKFDHERQIDLAGLRMKQQDQDVKHMAMAQKAADDRVLARQQAAKQAAAGKVSFTQP